jgi:ParB/RepB/Spo0J family partition protein
MIVLVDLKLIDDNPFQTRQSYPADAIQILAENIASLRGARPDTLGLIHVPVARPVGNEGKPLASLDISECRFQIAAGHCRLRAFRLLAEQDHDAWWRMPLDVSELDDQAMADVAWAENQKRRDLTPIERARALQTALSRFSWTQSAIGERWGLSQSAVANAIRLLDLPEWAIEAIHQGEISERHGRALLGLLPLAPPWPSKAILTFPDGIQRTAEALESEVRLQVDQKTRPLDKAPWWDSFQGWAPTDSIAEVRGSCQGCSCQVTVLRQERCTDATCYSAKTAAYKREVAGPGRARELHGNIQGWERVAVQPWTSCWPAVAAPARSWPCTWPAWPTTSVTGAARPFTWRSWIPTRWKARTSAARISARPR